MGAAHDDVLLGVVTGAAILGITRAAPPESIVAQRGQQRAPPNVDRNALKVRCVKRDEARAATHQRLHAVAAGPLLLLLLQRPPVLQRGITTALAGHRSISFSSSGCISHIYSASSAMIERRQDRSRVLSLNYLPFGRILDCSVDNALRCDAREIETSRFCARGTNVNVTPAKQLTCPDPT